MSLGPSKGKSVTWALLLTFALFSVIGFSLGLSLNKAIIYPAGISFIIFAWVIGLPQYIFSIFSTGSTIFTQIKGYLIRFISSLFYLVLFLGIFIFDDKSNTVRYITALSLFSSVWAFILYRRIKLIEDTPHSTLNSAAQGYSVLTGKVSLYKNEIIRAPHRELPVMVWYRKFLFISSAGFLLHDERSDGFCTIDPRDAEVITPYYHYSPYSYYAIYPDETVYVIGQLETLSKQRNEFERRGLVTSKIVNWKRHSIRFLNYFDKDGNGIVDDAEMTIVRQSASRIVDEELEEVYLQPANHVISRPSDGRPFILSSIHPDELITRYKRAKTFHLVTWIVLTLFIFAMQTYW